MHVATGRVAVCRHCNTPIVRDQTGCWIHTSRAYRCRDPWGFWASTNAEPRSDWTWLNSERR